MFHLNDVSKHLITIIGPTFTNRTSTFRVEVAVISVLSCLCAYLLEQTQHYDDNHDTQWFGQFNMLRW